MGDDSEFQERWDRDCSLGKNWGPDVKTTALNYWNLSRKAQDADIAELKEAEKLHCEQYRKDKEEIAQLRTQMEAWITIFGSSQLTHSIENAEIGMKRLTEAETIIQQFLDVFSDCELDYDIVPGEHAKVNMDFKIDSQLLVQTLLASQDLLGIKPEVPYTIHDGENTVSGTCTPKTEAKTDTFKQWKNKCVYRYKLPHDIRKDIYCIHQDNLHNKCGEEKCPTYKK